MNNKKLITIALTTAFAVGITAPVFADTTAAVADTRYSGCCNRSAAGYGIGNNSGRCTGNQ